MWSRTVLKSGQSLLFISADLNTHELIIQEHWLAVLLQLMILLHTSDCSSHRLPSFGDINEETNRMTWGSAELREQRPCLSGFLPSKGWAFWHSTCAVPWHKSSVWSLGESQPWSHIRIDHSTIDGFSHLPPFSYKFMRMFGAVMNTFLALEPTQDLFWSVKSIHLRKIRKCSDYREGQMISCLLHHSC